MVMTGIMGSHRTGAVVHKPPVLNPSSRCQCQIAPPSPWQLITLILATVLAVAALTAVPARLGGRRRVTETL
jgi:hypothetical protein